MMLHIVGMACAVGVDHGLAAFVRRIYAGVESQDVQQTRISLQDLVTDLGGGLRVSPGRDLPRVGGIVLRDADAPINHLTLRLSCDHSTCGDVDHRGTVLDVPTVQVDGTALVQALDLAAQWLDEGRVDLVLIGSEGPFHAAAILLKGDRRTPVEPAFPLTPAYATIIGTSVSSSRDSDRAFEQALRRLGLSVGDIGILESVTWPPDAEVVRDYRLHSSEASGTPNETGSRLVGPLVTGDSRQDAPDLSCVVSGPGFGMPVSPLLSLIKAVLCIERRMWVPTPSVTSPDPDVAWDDTPLFSVSDARPWLAPAQSRRVADVAHASGDQVAHVLVAEAKVRLDVPVMRPDLHTTRSHLVPVAGDSRAALIAGLESLRSAIAFGADLGTVAAERCRALSDSPSAAYALALVARDREELLKELDHAQDGLDKALATSIEWQTPRGSTFAPNPLGPEGVTFVYPGVFNAYPGMARDLFQHFPWLHNSLSEITADPGGVLGERWIYPRQRQKLTDEALKHYGAGLQDQPAVMIESGSTVAIAHTQIVREVFGVKPQAALGYSMGEVSMLWATGVWRDADASSRTLHRSALFRDVISGPMLAVKAYWGLGRDEVVDWATYLLKAKADRVRQAVAEENSLSRAKAPRVFVTFVNLDNEVVIAGEDIGCQRVIDRLQCHALPVPASVAIHNEAIHAAYEDLVALYTHPVAGKPDMTFYSAATYAPIRLEERALAEMMAIMCCQPVDFPRLVSRAYEDGARVFLELGPLGTCTRRIKRILRGSPHAAVAINSTPGEDLDGIVRALAVLVAHRVPVDLTPLHAAEEPVAVSEIGFALGTSHVPSLVGLLDFYGRHLMPQQHQAADLHRAFLMGRDAAQRRAGAVVGLQVAAGRRLLDVEPAPGHAQDDGNRNSRGSYASIAPEVGGLSDIGSSASLSADAFTLNRTYSRARPTAPVHFTGPPLFDEAALRAFAAGDVTQCFGSDFAVYHNRRLPRIPNGDLLMMSRVTEARGDPAVVAVPPGRELSGHGPMATLRSEFDVTPNAWFYQAGDVCRSMGYPGLPPYVVLMEMALQPCGFLSAYLRSSLLEPERDLYFRNLDGRGRVLADLDLRGKTVRGEVQLLTSTRGQGVIIQTFSFSLSCDGTPIYEGWSSFGYFPLSGLQRQVGLDAAHLGDGGTFTAAVDTWDLVTSTPVCGSAIALPPETGCAHEQVAPASDCWLLQPVDAGTLPTLLVRGQVRPQDWYFRNHFYQDPVMPGSLGVEAAMQAMARYARWRYPTLALDCAYQVLGHQVSWKYRGQITPEDLEWHAAIALTDVQDDRGGVTLTGDVTLWKSDLPIYRIEGAAVRLEAWAIDGLR